MSKFLDRAGLEHLVGRLSEHMGEGGAPLNYTDAYIQHLGQARNLLLPVSDSVYAFGLETTLNPLEYVDIILHNTQEDGYFLLSETSGFLDTFFTSRLEASEHFIFSPAKIFTDAGQVLATLIVHQESLEVYAMMDYIADCEIYLVYRTRYVEV